MAIRLTNEDWQSFGHLDGASEGNFEALWRALVMSNYGGKGRFVEYKNHPGVEFLLHLTTEIPELGPSGCIVGWQCKYYGTIRTGKALLEKSRGAVLDILDRVHAVVGDGFPRLADDAAARHVRSWI